MTIVVEPGKTIQAKVSWTNGGPLPYAPQARVNIRNSDFLATWLEGDWVRSPEVASGQRGMVVTSVKVPDDWDNKKIDVLVEAQNGSKKLLEQRDDLFIALKQRWSWPTNPAPILQWLNTEQTLVKAVAAPMHRGGAMPIWWGFGLYPVDYDAEWNIKPVYDPNSMLLGSDIWAGVWEDWGDDESWFTAPLQEFQREFPGGYTSGLYAALWIAQSESPIDRRNAGLPPITYQFGSESLKWDWVNVLWKQQPT